MTLPLWGPQSRMVPPPRQLTLVRLSAEIARSLAGIGRVAVEGEVYRPQTSRGGRVYFTLRDRAAQLSVTCPAANARRCRARHGERVVVVGQLIWGNDRGQLLLEADEVTPVGEGAVAAMIAEARARLAADGLLDRPRRAVPRLPRAIGVVCGADAAVRKDIESVVAARFPGFPMVFYETAVGGPGAAACITDAMTELAADPTVDVVVLARGGGDATALLPFSDEELCRAIATCPVPVVSAIGHDPDRPLCDEVADLRCGTPSLAAHAVVPDRAALEEELVGLLQAAGNELRRRWDWSAGRLDHAVPSGALVTGLSKARSRLDLSGQRLSWSHPRSRARLARERLEKCQWDRPFLACLSSGRERLRTLHRHAQALSPQHALDRGFAVVRRADGTVVRGPEQVGAGDKLTLLVARGEIPVTVTGGSVPSRKGG